MKLLVRIVFGGTFISFLLTSFKAEPFQAACNKRAGRTITALENTIAIKKKDDRFVIESNSGQPTPSTYDCNVRRFPEEDAYAAAVPAKYKTNIKDLVNYLVKPAKNDIEKARLIFTWIALNIAYDDHGFNTGRYSDCTPLGVLTSGKAVCQGYGDLFKEMGTLAGLNIVTVNGYGKGVGYREGSVFSETNHAWNAIKIDDRWKLFDVTWGEGYGTGVHGKLVTVKRFNDFWFDTDPKAFIFSHLPEDAKWQLNEVSISKSQFEKFPFTEDGYFEMGFDPETCFRDVLNGSLTEFPMAYGIDMLIHVVSLPYQKRMTNRKAYNIKINSVKACDIVIFNNKQLVHLDKNGNEFSGVIHPHTGKLTVDVRTDPRSTRYSTMLEYRVD